MPTPGRRKGTGCTENRHGGEVEPGDGRGHIHLAKLAPERAGG